MRIGLELKLLLRSKKKLYGRNLFYLEARFIHGVRFFIWGDNIMAYADIQIGQL